MYRPNDHLDLIKPTDEIEKTGFKVRFRRVIFL
jgi:hypothetical protein